MLQAQDIMTSEVVTVKEDASVQELAGILAANAISGVPVVNDNDELIGIVTESDLIDQNKKVHIPTVMSILDSFVFLENPVRLEKDLQKMAGTKAGEICSRKIISVVKDTPLDELATLMADKKIHTLPVMDGGKLVGVIGKSDIIRVISQGKL
jgi:CBS domain-containing protein